MLEKRFGLVAWVETEVGNNTVTERFSGTISSLCYTGAIIQLLSSRPRSSEIHVLTSSAFPGRFVRVPYTLAFFLLGLPLTVLVRMF